MTDDPAEYDYSFVTPRSQGGNFMETALRLTDELVAMEKDVERIEAMLEDAKGKVKNHIERTIPLALDEMEGTIDLPDGRKLILSEEVEASIAGEKRVPAIAWLDKNGYKHLPKRELVFKFGRGEDETAAMERFMAAVRESGVKVPMEEKHSVHHATLKSWVKEQLSEGVDLPADTFGIFRRKKAKVKD